MRLFLALALALPILAADVAPRLLPSVRIPVWNESNDPEGRATALKGLTARLNGQEAPVLNVRGPDDDLLLILVLDLTADLNLAEIAKQAAVTAISDLPAGTSVAILRAQDGVSVALDPTTDREALASTVSNSPVSGNAAFLDSVEVSARIADRVLSRTRVRTAVLYLTDSSIYRYRENYTNPVVNESDRRQDVSRRFSDGLIREKITSLEAKLASLQAPLFLVHLSYRTDPMEQAYQSGLLQIAGVTGGTALFCRSETEIAGTIRASFAKAASHQIVEIQAPAAHGRMIEVRIENGGSPISHRNRIFIQ